MAQAKLTVSKEQAVKLTCLVHKKKPVYPILYEPKSGVNLKETKGTETIEVPTSADLYNLKRFQEAGYFDVVEGTILPHTAAFSSISLNGTTLTLTFSGPITAPQLTSTTDGAITDDIILLINGEKTAATFSAVNAGTTITTTIPVTLEDVSVQITQKGASQIKDANRSAILPITKTTSPSPIFQKISVGGVGNTMLTLTFNEKVYTDGVSSTGLGQDTDDLVILVDGTATAITIGSVDKTAAATTLTVDMGAAPTSSVSVRITDAGAAKILDADDTAVDGVLTRTYSMKATDFTTFSFAEDTGIPTINGLNHTIAIEVANGTDVTGLIAVFTLSPGATAAIGATPQVSGTTVNDFTNTVTYKITAQDGTTTQNWVVTVTIAT
jgi:hypothetical protein